MMTLDLYMLTRIVLDLAIYMYTEKCLGFLDALDVVAQFKAQLTDGWPMAAVSGKLALNWLNIENEALWLGYLGCSLTCRSAVGYLLAHTERNVFAYLSAYIPG